MITMKNTMISIVYRAVSLPKKVVYGTQFAAHHLSK